MYVSYKAIGRNVSSARKEKSLTQAQLADQLGMSALHLGRMERGERPVSLEQLARIAERLGVTTYALMNGCLMREPHSAVPTVESADFARRMASVAAGCTSEEIALMDALCSTVAKHGKRG